MLHSTCKFIPGGFKPFFTFRSHFLILGWISWDIHWYRQRKVETCNFLCDFFKREIPSWNVEIHDEKYFFNQLLRLKLPHQWGTIPSVKEGGALLQDSVKFLILQLYMRAELGEKIASQMKSIKSPFICDKDGAMLDWSESVSAISMATTLSI